MCVDRKIFQEVVTEMRIKCFDLERKFDLLQDFLTTNVGDSVNIGGETSLHNNNTTKLFSCFTGGGFLTHTEWG